MRISINNPIQQTLIFTVLFVLILLISCRKKDSKTFFSPADTNELKGFAALAVVLSHVGYFLSTDNRFLFPWSVFAGVGVDMFLFLSGYGLTCSALKKIQKPWQFYKKRINKIYIPLWITLVAFFLLDFFVQKIQYSPSYSARALAGIITNADLYKDVNSPLWYITLIIFYYILFPWLFRKKYPLSSAVAFFFVPFLLLKLKLPITDGVGWLFSLHIIAFPIGIAFAVIANRLVSAKNLWLKTKAWADNNPATTLDIKIAASMLLALLASYLAVYSGVGKDKWTADITSVVTVILIAAAALAKPFTIKTLQILGVYSYEIYLLHWPIMYRFDFLYKYLPAGLATILYLAVFLGLGFVIQSTVSIILKPLQKK